VGSPLAALVLPKIPESAIDELVRSARDDHIRRRNVNNARTTRRSPSRIGKVAAAATALLVATLGTVATATTASAASSDCPVGYSCLWGSTGYRTDGVEDRLFKFYECQYNLGWVNYSGGTSANNSASSVSNRGNHNSARYYVDAAYAGPSFVLDKGTGDGNLGDASGNAPGGFNDALSSGKFASASATCQ
jgi:hypothetical protein